MRRSRALHQRVRREDYAVLGTIIDQPGLTTRQLAEACQRDYINNINKRSARWARRLEKWVYRVKRGNTYLWKPRRGVTRKQAQRDWKFWYE